MEYTDEKLIQDIQNILELLGNCDYTDVFLCKASQKKVIKAYSDLFNIKKKITLRNS